MLLVVNATQHCAQQIDLQSALQMSQKERVREFINAHLSSTQPHSQKHHFGGHGMDTIFLKLHSKSQYVSYV